MSFNLRDLEPGTLHLLTGGMKGFKTAQFLHIFDQLQYSGRQWQIIKPACDYRKELHERGGFPIEYLVSRSGFGLPATLYDDENPSDLLRKVDFSKEVIGIAEITLVKQDKAEELVEVVRYLLERDKVVVGEGLDKNFRGEPFHPMPSLMALASTVQKYYGICDVKSCGRAGEFPQRILDGKPAPYDSPVKAVGASDLYEIRCVQHHEVPGRPALKVKLS